MAGKSRSFPNLRPTSREYSPGVYPETQFTALNGAVTRVAYGNRRSQSTLSLGFTALSDKEVGEILDLYEKVNGEWDFIVFYQNNGLIGLDTEEDLYVFTRERASGLRYRFAEPPVITSIYPGASNVSCSFVAYLDD